MRVTQSMMSNNMLRNLNNSYSKMSNTQEQLSTGSKLLRPSDDPVATTKAIGYRTELAKNAQFTENLNTATEFVDATDTTLGSVNSALLRVQDLMTQAPNDTNVLTDRQAMKAEIDQIRQQIRDLANTQSGDKYIFSGTKTSTPLYADSSINVAAGQTIPLASMGGNSEAVKIELYDGITIDVNSSNAKGIFNKIDDMMSNIQSALDNPNTTGSTLSSFIGDVQNQSANVLQEQARIGAKQNRIDMMADRLSTQKINVTKQQSNVEDVDYEAAITNLITEESIHRSSLSVGGRVIQQTLVDFIK